MSRDHRKTLVKLNEGVYIERDVLNIAQRIKEYDPNLNIKVLDPSKSEFYDTPYLITETCRDGIERAIFGVWELNEKVLERIYAADTAKHDILTSLDINNAKAKANAKRRYEDVSLHRQDLMAHIFASPKGRFTFKNDKNQKVTISDTEPVKKETTKNNSKVFDLG